MKIILLLLISFLTTNLIVGQTFPTNPESSKLITTDIDNFWKAFDLMDKGYEGNPFDKNYMKIGSQGVIDFTPYRIESADTLFKNVRENKDKYLSIRESTLRIKEKKKTNFCFFLCA